MAQQKTNYLNLIVAFAVVHAAATFFLTTLSVLDLSPGSLEPNLQNLVKKSKICVGYSFR